MLTKNLQVTPPVRDYEAPVMLMHQISAESGFAQSDGAVSSISDWQEDGESLSF